MSHFRETRTAVGAVLTACLISGCASTPFKAYDGPDLPEHEAVLLDWSACGVSCDITIDGRALPRHALFVTGRLPIERAWLKPGTHVIEFNGSFGYTGDFYIRRFVTYQNSATIPMRAGHRYAVIHKRKRGWGMGNFRDYLWIENATTGEIVAGSAPPH